MAVADALAEFCGAKLPSPILAVQIADRGKRSAVGIHGYLHGGLIFEAGDPLINSELSSGSNLPSNRNLNPIVQRVELPDQWTVVLASPMQPSETVFGTDEQQQFSQLNAASKKQTDALKEVVVDRLIPAAQSGDFPSFAAAVHHYNHQSGMLFSQVQGGAYNGPQVTQTIELLQQYGAQGVGQSSWGPSVFSWFATKREAEEFVASFPIGSLTIDIVEVKNGPADRQVA